MRNKWSSRSTLYQVTLVLTYFIFLVFALAFSIPTWFGTDGTDNNDYFMGLWVRCTGGDQKDFDDCKKQAFGDDEDWIDGVRGVWIGGMFFFLLAVIYSFFENFLCSEDNTDYAITGILTFLAGACGAAGVIVVAVEIEEHGDEDGVDDYFWGYMLACIASGLALILSIVLMLTRNMQRDNEKSRSQVRAADYVSAHQHKTQYPTSYPTTQEYPNHGYYPGNDIPLTNGVTYQHSPANQPGYGMYHGGPYTTNSLPHPVRNGGYGQSQGYSPYGYQRHSMAESADLSNGYTTELINAEHSLSRTHVSNRGDFVSNNYYRPY